MEIVGKKRRKISFRVRLIPQIQGLNEHPRRLPGGYVAMRARGERGYLWFAVDNLRQHEMTSNPACYKAWLILRGSTRLCAGTIDVDARGRGVIIWEFNPDNIGATGMTAEDITGFAVTLEAQEPAGVQGGREILHCDLPGTEDTNFKGADPGKTPYIGEKTDDGKEDTVDAGYLSLFNRQRSTGTENRGAPGGGTDSPVMTPWPAMPRSQGYMPWGGFWPWTQSQVFTAPWLNYPVVFSGWGFNYPYPGRGTPKMAPYAPRGEQPISPFPVENRWWKITFPPGERTTEPGHHLLVGVQLFGGQLQYIMIGIPATPGETGPDQNLRALRFWRPENPSTHSVQTGGYWLACLDPRTLEKIDYEPARSEPESSAATDSEAQ